MTLRVIASVAQAMLTALATAVDADVGAASIKVYTGTQPASPAASVTGTLLVTFAFGDPAFNAATSVTNYAEMSAAAIASAVAVATGNAGWFRVADNSGDAIYDGAVTVTGGGGEMTIGNIAIASGATVNVTGLKISLPKGY